MVNEEKLLPKDKFLSGEVPSCLIDELYELYKKVHLFLLQLNNKIKVVSVERGGPDWDNSGAVKITIDTDDKGVVFHEVGHALLANSVFHRNHNPINAKRNEAWGEAVAEAIRWLMENEYIKPQSKWSKEDFERQKEQKGTNIYKANIILSKCGYTLEGFKKMWLELVSEFDNTADYLDRQFSQGGFTEF